MYLSRSRYLLFITLLCSFLGLGFVSAAALEFGDVELPPGVPEGSAPLGTDPATGRPMFMVPDNSDPKVVAALQGTLRFDELALYDCERNIRDELKKMDANERSEFDKGPPKGSAGKGHGAGGHDRLDNDPYFGGTVLNPQQDQGPILLGGNVVASLEKAKKRQRKKKWDCLELYALSLWVQLDPDIRKPFNEFYTPDD